MRRNNDKKRKFFGRSSSKNYRDRSKKRDKQRGRNTNQILCKICKHPIVNTKTALKHPEGGFVHFDCAIREISAKENLNKGEEIYYVGGGAFAVVSNIKYSKGGSVIGFKVERRIQYETKENSSR